MKKNKQSNNTSSHHWTDELTYEIHTGRELELMLQGKKPLAVFSGTSFADDSDSTEQAFEKYVEEGLFVKQEVFDAWTDKPVIGGRTALGYRVRLYALTHEAWRIPAYLLFRRVLEKCRWNEALERLEGWLLGYTDEQNEEWLAKRREQHAGWGCITLYATTTSKIFDKIADLGERAFPNEFLQSARFFLAGHLPKRSSLEEVGLLSEHLGIVVRFGVTKDFFFDSVERGQLRELTPVTLRDSVSSRDLNNALLTDIQIQKPID
ncbi:hypothetical protein [Microvirga brassicacearum]|uniref:Uncharacterized protein n=1 Tax=Microvirga brassicacearum TaxID=2580413 RepID=A0A5N3P4N1_9HYPH|nr:hypothetical protein [Microvirga brassicacearum]KAB0264663.1 hypothetical protein FEZ63_21665 [Microvirga brassicacearum]